MESTLALFPGSITAGGGGGVLPTRACGRGYYAHTQGVHTLVWSNIILCMHGPCSCSPAALLCDRYYVNQCFQYQGAPPPPPFLTWFPLMWSSECLICFDLMENFSFPPPPPLSFCTWGKHWSTDQQAHHNSQHSYVKTDAMIPQFLIRQTSTCMRTQTINIKCDVQYQNL